MRLTRFLGWLALLALLPACASARPEFPYLPKAVEEAIEKSQKQILIKVWFKDGEYGGVDRGSAFVVGENLILGAVHESFAAGPVKKEIGKREITFGGIPATLCNI